jgi:hypothetical protein
MVASASTASSSAPAATAVEYINLPLKQVLVSASSGSYWYDNGRDSNESDSEPEPMHTQYLKSLYRKAAVALERIIMVERMFGEMVELAVNAPLKDEDEGEVLKTVGMSIEEATMWHAEMCGIDPFTEFYEKVERGMAPLRVLWFFCFGFRVMV